MTTTDRTTLLCRNGYSAEEAEFLCLVADAGGYFLRQHYRRFRGTKRTRAEGKLAHKLVAHQHARVYLGPRGIEVFHLSARSFYRFIGSPESRNRRRRPESFIRSRLLTLDYLLANRGERFLFTDAEKLVYFVDERRIPSCFLALKGGRFIDRYPVSVAPESPGLSPVVSFCDVESKVFDARRFRSFLKRQRYLWESLEAVRLVYITERKWNSTLAERSFRSFVYDHWPQPKARKPTFREEIIAAFRARYVVQSGSVWRLSFSDEMLIDKVKRRIGATHFEVLYSEWMLISDRSVYDSIPPEPCELCRPPSFKAHVVHADYSFLNA